MNDAATTRPRRSWLARTLAIAVLSAVWVLLWNDVSLANTLLGIMLACLVVLVFPLPTVPFHDRVRPLGVLAYLGHFFVDLISASFEVARLAVRRGPPPRSAIVAVPMQTDSEIALSMTAITLSLVPGSLVLDVDRSNSRLYLHVLEVDEQGIEGFRQSVYALEARVLRAIGSTEELARLQPRQAGIDPPRSEGAS